MVSARSASTPFLIKARHSILGLFINDSCHYGRIGSFLQAHDKVFFVK